MVRSRRLQHQSMVSFLRKGDVVPLAIIIILAVDIRRGYELLKCGLMREVRGKGVSTIRKDTTYNSYKSDHFEFMLCEKIIARTRFCAHCLENRTC